MPSTQLSFATEAEHRAWLAGQSALPEGFRVEVFASEPEIRQPVAACFDERGRMWVIEYLQYPVPAGLSSFVWSGNGRTNVSGTISDTIASLAPGTTVVYTVTATASPSATGSLSNTVTVTLGSACPLITGVLV